MNILMMTNTFTPHVGGPSSRAIRQIFFREKMAGRLHMAGVLDHPLLTSAYRAMDVFVFASKSETQGMVLIEAMAAGAAADAALSVHEPGGKT
jgi:glycosyltransferase involved in cell wall biosynthesis